ncbi:MAG: VanZ family protein [Anaerolineales bacterium]|nr:VanZ family protein [Chloroflexota bacterium]MBL6983220.1 VanZ family protein [Anaerolineales bacterium]
MKNQIQHSPLVRRIITWGLIVGYTLILPSAILIYRRLESVIGQEATGKIPFYGVIIIGIAYTVYGFLKNRNFTHLLYLIPGAIIAYIIIRYEPNPNKHIHIPEYVLMAWLLYAALSKDYQGKGILILIFICGSLLGVVDEIEQGLHPKRFYGWSDMAVNSSSTLIGIFTLMGLTKRKLGDWGWRRHLREFRALIGLILYGVVGAVFMCIHLFDVQAQEMFWGVYPLWILVWNLLFLLGTLVAAGLEVNKQRSQQLSEIESENALRQTAQLWTYLPLAILFFIHFLVVYAGISGTSFR